jgi:adenylate kinase family enzyme
MIEQGREHGVKVAALAGTVEHARRHVEAGVDIVVAQGYEAGGHTGTISTLVLVPEVVASGGQVDRALLIEVPIEDLVGRFAGRLICKAGGHVYNEWFKPPREWGVCDVDGSELVHRADDAEATVRARMEQQLGPLHEVADYYRARGILTPVDGLRPIEDVAAALLEALGRPSGAAG